MNSGTKKPPDQVCICYHAVFFWLAKQQSRKIPAIFTNPETEKFSTPQITEIG